MATFQKTQAGNWRAIIRRKGYKSLSKTFPKKVLAERWARQKEECISRDIVTPEADKTTLGVLIDRYLAEFTPRKRASQSETSHLKTVKMHLGAYMLSDLRSSVLIRYVDARLMSVSADTVRKELSKLAVVIDAGIGLWGIDLVANPVHTAKRALGVTKTLPSGRKRERRPSVDELDILFASRIGVLVEFAVETAMRRGEIAKMLPQHVDGDVLVIPETKTDKVRTIPLSLRARELLNGFSGWGLMPDSITQAFERVCAANGIVGLRFHDLRHEGTSRLFERGLSIEEVATITGHADWASLKRYTHLCPRYLAAKIG